MGRSKMFVSVEPPFAEVYMDNRWLTKGARGGSNKGVRRSAPAELPFAVQQDRVWKQGSKVLHAHKPAMYLVRPHDGKSTGGVGRFFDVLSGEGPDVFVTKCGDKRTLMRDRPQRWQWSGWGLTKAEKDDRRLHDKDFRKRDLQKVKDWLPANAKLRARKSRYDFKTRKYESKRRLASRPKGAVWSDARWEDGAHRRDREPLSYRNAKREWYSRVPADAGNWAGGRPRNHP